MTDHEPLRPVVRAPRLRRWSAVSLWLQVALFTLGWVLPIGLVAAVLLTNGVSDDESADYLLIPVIFAAAPFVLSATGIALAVALSRGRHSVRAGVIGYELLVVPSAGLLAVWIANPYSVPFVAVALLGLAVLFGVCRPAECRSAAPGVVR